MDISRVIDAFIAAAHITLIEYGKEKNELFVINCNREDIVNCKKEGYIITTHDNFMPNPLYDMSLRGRYENEHIKIVFMEKVV